MRGILGAMPQEPQPSIGLAGMRAPTSSAKPLIPTPLIRPVKAPIGEVKPATASILPRPIKLGTQVVPSADEMIPEEELAEAVQSVEEVSSMGEAIDTDRTDEQSVGETTLRPITKTMIPQQQPSTTVANLTPVKHMLEPAKKSRGAPPPKDLGKKSQMLMNDNWANNAVFISCKHLGRL